MVTRTLPPGLVVGDHSQQHGLYSRPYLASSTAFSSCFILVKYSLSISSAAASTTESWLL